ncbi:MAG: DMT family transporter [Rubrivivax sp.]
MPAPTAALSPRAFATLLLVAFMFGANHVAARIAFDHGANVVTAVAVRSLATAAAVAALIWLQRVPLRLDGRQRRVMPLIGALVTLQSLCLYAAVARLPVALALLVFNTFPLWTALAARVVYGARPQRRVLLAMPVILTGLALALDVSGAAGGLGAGAHWSRIGGGVALALAAAAAVGVVLALTQHAVAAVDGRVRTMLTMAMVGTLALIGAGLGEASGLLPGLRWPDAAAGWWGLLALSALYGTAITILFTVLPRLGVVGNSPILNVEPVWALAMAWAILGQRIAPTQLLGAALVVGAVVTLGLRRPAPPASTAPRGS